MPLTKSFFFYNFMFFALFGLYQNVQAQSRVVYRLALNKQLKPLPSEKFAFAIEERWKENGLWRAKLIHNETGKLMAEYAYLDSNRQTKQGPYIEYYENRKKKLEYTYVNGEIDGPFEEWSSDGILFQKGMRSGETYWGHMVQYFADGVQKMECDIDKQGNGTGKEMLAKAGITGTGAMKGGKQNGNWIYADSSGMKVMEVLYNEQGIEKETCFDKDGKPKTGSECISDRRPEFPGGESAWLQFLQKNLAYPKDLRKAQVQGVVNVKFLVKVDGSLSGFKVLESPDPELSSEALRVLRLSPKWTPSIEFNKPVPFTHIQAITFQLK